MNSSLHSYLETVCLVTVNLRYICLYRNRKPWNQPNNLWIQYWGWLLVSFPKWLFFFNIEKENIWILMSVQFYIMKNTKRRPRKWKENGKIKLKPKRTVHDSLFDCLVISMEYLMWCFQSNTNLWNRPSVSTATLPSGCEFHKAP